MDKETAVEQLKALEKEACLKMLKSDKTVLAALAMVEVKDWPLFKEFLIHFHKEAFKEGCLAFGGVQKAILEAGQAIRAAQDGKKEPA